MITQNFSDLFIVVHETLGVTPAVLGVLKNGKFLLNPTSSAFIPSITRYKSS
ncbi:hypothetical protein HanRHA438_Chr11g0525491 [Helianthus annuus]|nr:hypothetical protein HanRHA438_Chr11g0525491 [Helianthus annuus]